VLNNLIGAMSSNECYLLSGDNVGADFAVTSHDGRLSIWDGRLSGRIKHEFVPSAHLASVTTSLAWMPPAPSRNRKTSTSSLNGSTVSGSPQISDKSRNSDALALGTASGSVLIFSLKSGDVSVHLAKKNAPHKDQVNGIVWSSNCDDLYSVSKDGFISHSSVKRCSVLTRFRGSSSSSGNEGAVEPLSAVGLHPSERSVLVGSLSRLTWWDLDTQSTLKTFEGGHVGFVSSLAVVTSSTHNCYVITGGNNVQKDHTLTVWPLALAETGSSESPTKKSSRNSQSVSAPPLKFSVNESVRSIFTKADGGPGGGQKAKGRTRKTSVGNDNEDDIEFGVVTHSGVVHTFLHNFLGSVNAGAATPKKRKPVKAKNTLQIATEKAADGSVGAVPVLDARFVDNGSELALAHGSKLAPTLERLELCTLEKLTCLIRTPKPLSSSKEGDLTTGGSLVVPDTSGVKVLAPGPSLPLISDSKTASKRKKAGADMEDTVSMVDRLRLLSREEDQKTRAPQTDSMIQLLLQGLHNRDRRILDSVLDRANDDLIENTVKKLPVEGVIPLVQELQHYIKGRGMVNQSHSKWLRSTLQVHTGHLMNSPQCAELLGPIYAMLEARTRHYNSLLQLKGKLEIMTKQINAKAQEVATGAPEEESAVAKFVYHDDSGDEDENVDQMLVCPPSDTDDNWLMDEGDDDDDEEEDEVDVDKNDGEGSEDDDDEVEDVEAEEKEDEDDEMLSD